MGLFGQSAACAPGCKAEENTNPVRHAPTKRNIFAKFSRWMNRIMGFNLLFDHRAGGFDQIRPFLIFRIQKCFCLRTIPIDNIQTRRL